MNTPLLNKNLHTVDYWVSRTPESETWTAIYNIVLFRGKENETTISGFDIIHTMLHDYGKFYAYSVETYVDWVFEWERFARIHTHDFERIYTALFSDYNPIENYDKYSQITNNGSTGANPENPFMTKMYQVTDDTVNSAGDAAYVPQGKTTTEGKTDTENEMNEHTHGNIGVTKATDMINDEITLRVNKSIIEIIVRMFAEMELI